MINTPNYNLNIVEGTDYVNPLTQTNPNFETIDTEMKRNADNSVTLATELKTGTVHALTRINTSASVFRFVATSDFVTGDTFTVDGTQVTALQTNGQPLADRSYVINANVLCVLTGTILTVYVQGGATLAEDSEKLGGELPSYYATKAELTEARESAISAGNVANNALQIANAALDKTGIDLIWTNPEPNAELKAKTIPLNNTTKYKYFIVSMMGTTTASGERNDIVFRNIPTHITSAGTRQMRYRTITIFDTSAEFGAGRIYEDYDGSAKDLNTGCIFTKIYGVK